MSVDIFNTYQFSVNCSTAKIIYFAEFIQQLLFGRKITLGLRRILKLSTKTALSTLILIIPLALGLWENLDFVYKILLILVTGVLNIVFVYYDYKQPTWEIRNLLELMVRSLWGPNQASHFRSNIMVQDHKTKKLCIKDHYNMMGAIDRAFTVDPNQGCAGRAFSTQRPFWVDVTKSTHEKYLIDSGQVWASMKSVMSVPIVLQGKNMGVLNIDSDLDINTSKLNQEKVYSTAMAYSDIIARLL